MQIGYSCTQEKCGRCSSDDCAPIHIDMGVSGVALLLCGSPECIDAVRPNSMVSKKLIRACFKDMLAMHPLLGLCQVADLDAFAKPSAPSCIMVWISPVDVKHPPQEVPLLHLHGYNPLATIHYVYPKVTPEIPIFQCDFCLTRDARLCRSHLGIGEPFCIDACEECVRRGMVQQCIAMHTFTVGSRQLRVRKAQGLVTVPGQIVSRIHANDYLVPAHWMTNGRFTGKYMKATCLQ